MGNHAANKYFPVDQKAQRFLVEGFDRPAMIDFLFVKLAVECRAGRSFHTADDTRRRAHRRDGVDGSEECSGAILQNLAEQLLGLDPLNEPLIEFVDLLFERELQPGATRLYCD